MKCSISVYKITYYSVVQFTNLTITRHLLHNECISMLTRRCSGERVGSCYIHCRQEVYIRTYVYMWSSSIMAFTYTLYTHTVCIYHYPLSMHLKHPCMCCVCIHQNLPVVGSGHELTYPANTQNCVWEWCTVLQRLLMHHCNPHYIHTYIQYILPCKTCEHCMYAPLICTLVLIG